MNLTIPVGVISSTENWTVFGYYITSNFRDIKHQEFVFSFGITTKIKIQNLNIWN